MTRPLDPRLDRAMWEGDVDTLQELAPCACCCSEHTFGEGDTYDTDAEES